jgi:hypothetical protein
LLLVGVGVTLPAPAGAQTPTGIAELRAPRGPFDASVPLPESVLGHYPGQDFQLADWPTILEYLETLAASSDRMVLEEIGRSTEGQPLVVALISSPDNLRERERYRGISEQLARARVDEAAAAELVAEGRAIVWIDSGLHATEVAHGQHAPELAYVLVAGESDELQRMRDDVIVVLMPNMNPDGLNIVTEWYRQNLGTPFETAPLPVLYQKYVGHDNNRDWYMITQPETRAVSEQLYRRWYPQIVYNHHQTAPFPARMFVPPFDDPANPNIPPLVLRGIARVGNAISTRLEMEGKSGVVSRVGFTAWWNGGMRTVPYFHNMIGILTETALYRYATPRFYAPDELPAEFRDGTSARQSMKYPMPWPGGWWRLRDPVEYMLTASIATIDVASRYREDFLHNIYRMGRRAIDRGVASPSGWVIPVAQHDEAAMTELVNVLVRGGLDVMRADADFEADGRSYPAGSYFVPASQAFGAYATDLLEPQRYPDRRLYPDGPPDPPYDMAGWTLPFQMGVAVQRTEAPVTATMEPVTGPIRPEGRLLGEGSTYVIDPRNTRAAKAVNELLAGGAEVYRSSDAVRTATGLLPPGTFLVRDRPGLAGRLAALAEEGGASIVATDERVRGSGWKLRRPRVALYEPWVASMDAGWTRYVLEQYAFPYEVVRNSDLHKGDLGDLHDVVILPSMSASALMDGHADTVMPPEFAGGLGAAGIAALREFVAGGGTVVALDHAGDLVIEELDVPVTDVLEGLSQEEFFCPGSLLRIQVDTAHPLGYGMPSTATAFFVRSQAFVTEEGGAAVSVARYAETALLESGWILGEDHLHGRSAVVEIPMGAGRIVLLGFRTHFRAQSHETFKIFFNSLWLAGAEPAALP